MKYQDVRELYYQMDAPFGCDIDDSHFYMQAWARDKDHLHVIRFGADGGRNYYYQLPAGSKVPPVRGRGCSLDCGLDSRSRYEWGELKDTFDSLDWQICDLDYIKQLAEEHVRQAAYELEEAQNALKLIKSCEE